jgi:RNA polymerase sigma factor (sigma-70 family)
MGDTTNIPEFTRLLLDNFGKGGEGEERLLDVLKARLTRRAASLLSHPMNQRLKGVVDVDELVNMVYVRLRTTADNKGGLTIANRGHFLGMAVDAMKNALTDIARRGGDARQRWEVAMPLDISDVAGGGPISVDRLDFDRKLETLRELNPRQAEAINLRFYVGLTQDEAAEAAGLSSAQHKRDLRFALDWLRDELTS